MCWSAEISLQSFAIGITAVGIAYSKGLSLPMTFFCLTIVCMQLVEYIAWSNIDNPDVNYYSSIAASFLLWLQPVASMLTLPSSLFPSFFGTYLVFSFLVKALETKYTRELYRMYRGDNGHLVWNFLQKDRLTFLSLVVYFFFLFVPLIQGRQWLIMGVASTTLLLSLWNFWKHNTWGSMWCWIVNYIVVCVSVNQVLIAKP